MPLPKLTMKHLASLLILIFALTFASNAYPKVVPDSETSYDREKGEKKVHGQRFSIAEDRRIEATGKYFEPEGLDKYFGRKMDKVLGVIEALSSRLALIEKKLAEVETSLSEVSNKIDAIPEEVETYRNTPMQPDQGGMPEVEFMSPVESTE